MWLLAWGCGVVHADGSAITFGEACALMGMLGCTILIPGPPGLLGVFQAGIYAGMTMYFPTARRHRRRLGVRVPPLRHPARLDDRGAPASSSSAIARRSRSSRTRRASAASEALPPPAARCSASEPPPPSIDQRATASELTRPRKLGATSPAARRSHEGCARRFAVVSCCCAPLVGALIVLAPAAPASAKSAYDSAYGFDRTWNAGPAPRPRRPRAQGDREGRHERLPALRLQVARERAEARARLDGVHQGQGRRGPRRRADRADARLPRAGARRSPRSGSSATSTAIHRRSRRCPPPRRTRAPDGESP